MKKVIWECDLCHQYMHEDVHQDIVFKEFNVKFCINDYSEEQGTFITICRDCQDKLKRLMKDGERLWS